MPAMADRDEVLAKLAHLRRRAYKPVVEPGDGVATDGKFGGTPYLPEGQDWPPCGHCNEPMALVVQLNPSQLPEPLRKTYGTDLIQLFYCTSDEPLCCDVAEAWRPDSVANLARQVGIAGDPATPTRRPEHEVEPAVIRRWSAVDDYPIGVERERLGVELEDDEVELAYELTQNGDKLSGWPLWIQDVEYPSCPECGKTMRLVFQIDSDDNTDINLGDTGCGHLTQCPDHKHVLAFGWACA